MQTEDGVIPLDPMFADNGTLVPNKRINRKTGAVVDTSQNNNIVNLDPTGNFYFDRKGNPHAVPQAMQFNMQLGNQPPATTAPPAWWQIGPLAPSATPAPATTPSATPTPSPTPSGRVLSAADQQALDWALNNPKDPDAAAIKQRLGIQ